MGLALASKGLGYLGRSAITANLNIEMDRHAVCQMI